MCTKVYGHRTISLHRPFEVKPFWRFDVEIYTVYLFLLGTIFMKDHLRMSG